jgi:hypothetical protein
MNRLQSYALRSAVVRTVRRSSLHSRIRDDHDVDSIGGAAAEGSAPGPWARDLYSPGDYSRRSA